MIESSYPLMCGGMRLGVLTPYGVDFPRVKCHFVADPAFRRIQPLFEELHRLMSLPPEDGEKYTEAWRKERKQIDEQIAAFDLYLLRQDGRKGKPPRLFIHDGKAIFGMFNWNASIEHSAR